jgi:hypothetical protein
MWHGLIITFFKKINFKIQSIVKNLSIYPKKFPIIKKMNNFFKNFKFFVF